MWKSKHSEQSTMDQFRRFGTDDQGLPMQRCEDSSDLIVQKRPSRWGGNAIGTLHLSSSNNRPESCPPSHPEFPALLNSTKRVASLEQQYLKKLEEERIRVLDHAAKRSLSISSLPDYLAQPKRTQRPYEKVYIPVKEYPNINFFGLLVGPRGNSLKKMERESGAKISIRGKGSVKEGKLRPEHVPDDVEDDLHCLVVADSDESVRACVKMINHIIETAASTPEGQNDHKRSQLRELAALNGTLRDDENQLCQNCGLLGHRKYECIQRHINNSSILCRTCGNPGHIARDCLTGKPAKPTSQVPYEAEYPALRNATNSSTFPQIMDFSSSHHSFSSNAHWSPKLIPQISVNSSDFSLTGGNLLGEHSSSWLPQHTARNLVGLSAPVRPQHIHHPHSQ